jgi:translation initiation factor 2 beta subunit (eIF-2beta)/eIF-5
MKCQRCSRTHKGKYPMCSTCGTADRMRLVQQAKREFWRPCLAVAGEYVLRAMKVKT